MPAFRTDGKDLTFSCEENCFLTSLGMRRYCGAGWKCQEQRFAIFRRIFPAAARTLPRVRSPNGHASCGSGQLTGVKRETSRHGGLACGIGSETRVNRMFLGRPAETFSSVTSPAALRMNASDKSPGSVSNGWFRWEPVVSIFATFWKRHECLPRRCEVAHPYLHGSHLRKMPLEMFVPFPYPSYCFI